MPTEVKAKWTTMSLSPGTRLGAYEIVEAIGAGGMGEVFLARDTHLGRDVALKFVPAAFTGDVERMARFQREARVLASLNHPNIATLHGLEEADGQQFLVMELVEGDDLSVTLARGPLSVNEALRVARDVADALQTAHAQGIVHRDLKPANIKVTPDGRVKVLDFGLAKALSADSSDPRISQSPTVMLSATMQGVVLGTAAYMSPEQARGRPVDKLTDVWAMGCVLYEMLTARTAFPGETVSDTIAKILEREPDWSLLPADTPPSVQRLLRRCLQKDKSTRLQDVGEVRVEVSGSLSGQSAAWGGADVDAPGAAKARRPWLWMGLTALAAAAAVFFALRGSHEDTAPAPVMRTTIEAPENSRFVSTSDFGGPVILSPDGKRIAFVGLNPERRRALFVRELYDVTPRIVPGTEGATFPFWSPDGKSLAYFADGKLSRVDLSRGGLPITLCAANGGRGGSWGPNGVILVSPDFRSPICRIPEAGGELQSITVIDTTRHSTHRWPDFLPDGKHFLFFAAHHELGKSAEYGVMFASIDGGDSKFVINTLSDGTFCDGYLLYVRENTLMAAPFDPETGSLLGESVAMPDKVQYDPTTWHTSFTTSATGLLAYHRGEAAVGQGRLLFVDPTGKAVREIKETQTFYGLAISPDRSQVAVSAGIPSMGSFELDIWVHDISTGLKRRLTFEAGTELSPVWSPDGKEIAFARIWVGKLGQKHSIRVTRAVGGGERVLMESDNQLWLTDWSRDGKTILFSRGTFLGVDAELWALPVDGKSAPYQIAEGGTPYKDNAAMSPDGRWVAYERWESGAASLIFVSPMVPPGDSRNLAELPRWQISSDEGWVPRWRSDGRELYLVRTDSEIIAVSVDGSGEQFQVGQSRRILTADLAQNVNRVVLTASADGQLFGFAANSENAEQSVIFVQNWRKEVRGQR